MIVVKNRAGGDTNSVVVMSENKIEDMIQKELVEEIKRFILQLKFQRVRIYTSDCSWCTSITNLL